MGEQAAVRESLPAAGAQRWVRRCRQQQPWVMDGAVRQPQMFPPSSSPVPRSLLAAGREGGSGAGIAAGSRLPSQASRLSLVPLFFDCFPLAWERPRAGG